MNDQSTAKLREALNANLTDYAAIPFWSWNNELDEDSLVKQIVEMYEVGMGGFIMHARIGLKTEYLGEKWFSCIDACLRKAKELGMNAWIYDENGWPSGFVGGKLLEVEEYRAQFLEYEVKTDFDENALGVYKKVDKGFARIFGKECGLKEYHCVYLRTSPANTDILNPNVVDAFIKETHEEYYKRFKDSFGKELVGFFTDEPQYYRWGTPYSRYAAEEYKKQYGGDIADGLVYLFVSDENGYEFRTRYYKTLNELYTINFYKKLYDWCDSHNCKLTGHSVEESCLHGQMWGGAACMPSYEFEHIPGVDCLGRECPTPFAFKQVGSVSQQLGFRQVLTETYGCSGYDVTPQELKSIAEAQYFNGVNLMCHHLLPYSMAGQGKHDHPPVFSKQNNWYEEFKGFNDYFTRLGYLVANTDENYDVAILHPMRNVYLDYIRALDGASCQELSQSFDALLNKLQANGVQYHFIDERILQHYGKIVDGKLQVGKCVYDTLIIPEMKSIASTSLEILKGYTAKMLLVGDSISYVDGKPAFVNLSSNTTMQQIIDNTKIYFRCTDGYACVTSRTSELGDYIFIKNHSRTESASFVCRGVAENYKALDMSTMTLRNISNEYTLPKNEGLVLIKDGTAKDEKITKTSCMITDKFTVTDVTKNCLVLDYASYGFDGKTFGERMPLPKAFEQLLRADYKGPVYIRQTFMVKEKCPMKLFLEKSRFIFAQLNGVDLKLGDNDFDINFTEADITDLIKEGENVFVYGVDYFQHEGVHFALFDPMATESVRNCLYYDTHIENAFLEGDFFVNADLSIEKRKTMPKLSTDNYKNGYPFFKGVVTLAGEYDYDGVGARSIALHGRFIVADIIINGKCVDMTMDVVKEIAPYLVKGKNDIKILLKSSLRNMFGPHHFKPIKEPLGVSPVVFTMRGEWGDGDAINYTDEYNSVPFGVDEIEMITF